MTHQMNSYRICGEEKDCYYLLDTQERVFRGELKGKLRLTADAWPSVGDYILGTHQPGDWVLIEEILGRRNALQRRDPGGRGFQIFASNVDYAFIVTSANDDLNEKRLDRYVALAYSCDVTPVIVVNKSELAADIERVVEELQRRFPACDIFGVSVYAKKNLEVLKNYFQPGKTGVFIGSSGVGKSSLTNELLGREENSIQPVRDSDNKGRHTTTRRSLHQIPNGGAIIDTPGIRSLALVDGESGVSELFADVLNLAEHCQFRDCQHQTEPNCAVREALAQGSLDSSRWESFQKLQRESSFVHAKEDKRAQREKKRDTVKAMRLYKEIKRDRQRR